MTPSRGSKTFPPPGAERKDGASKRADVDDEDSPFDRPTLIPSEPPEELSAGLRRAPRDEDSGVVVRRSISAPATEVVPMPFDPIPTPPEGTRRRTADPSFESPRPRSQMPTIAEDDPLAFDVVAMRAPKLPDVPSVPRVPSDAFELDIVSPPTKPRAREELAEGAEKPRLRRDNVQTQPDPLASRRDSTSRVRTGAPANTAETVPPPSSETHEGSALNLVGKPKGDRRTTRNRTAPKPPDPTTDMRDRFALGDFSGALVVAESVLENDPSNAEAARYAENCRERLRQMYASRLGSLTRVPRVIVPPDQVRWLSLDHRSGFILSCVDGYSTIEEILDVSGMPALDALRLLYELLQQRIIAVG